MQLGENSITDFYLLNFKYWLDKHNHSIKIHHYTQYEEGSTGADWAWLFTDPSGQWFGFLIQAKVMNFKKGSFEKLYYQNHKTKQKQVDLLIQHAKNESLIPLYALYLNWENRKYDKSSSCKTFSNSITHYGASLLNPHFVKRNHALKNKPKSLAALLAQLKPLHCIFCPALMNQSGLVQSVARWAEQNLPESTRDTSTLIQDGKPPLLTYFETASEASQENDLSKNVLTDYGNVKGLTVVEQFEQ
ncbi:DUF6615 family protein [Arenicella xantha]|uniref:Uncharacterized protein n=1 Tax=Arenicella xantha TaxID=644221 RepID=A0A395JN55_9GAMM|nr:DUF6615 family protein [Arenicella xantha]RBP52907.1 hypothetical protein DFR28_101291 [Arenicella xantha]